MAQAAFCAPRPAGDSNWGEWFSGDALACAQDAPGKSADGLYVWSLKKGCAVDPD